MAIAEADPGTGVLRPAHRGAWTEEAYLALPAADRVTRRVELLDGSLLVAPGTGERHAAAVAVVRAAVAAVLPAGLEVTGPVALRLAPGRILVPDLVVAAPPVDDGAEEVRDSTVALMVVDVVGRVNGVADRSFKPQLYAGCRIPYALLVDHDEPFAVGSMLIGGRFHEYAEAGPGDVLRLDEPFALELDLAALVADTGGPGPAPAGPAAAGPPTAAPSTAAPSTAAPSTAAHALDGAADPDGAAGADPAGPAGSPHDVPGWSPQPVPAAPDPDATPPGGVDGPADAHRGAPPRP